jgi:hypothetical protein
MTIDPPFDPLKERLQRAVAPDYRVEHRIGEGGMGVVYRAHEVLMNRGVAIKVLRPESWTAEGAESFLREAQMMGSVPHKNVVVIFRPGEGQGLQYYIMELVHGPTLEGRLEAGPIPPDDAVRIGSDLLQGLQALHRQGFVHRDIKPSNVFVLSDRALLGDFGIARPPSDDVKDSHNRDCTPDYGAPEQVAGGLITPRTDIYSTGVVLYDAVSGRRFHEQGERVDWSGIPGRLARVLQRAVLKQPEARWPDAATFRKKLERTVAPHVGRSVAALLTAGVLVGVGGLGAWISLGSPETKPGALKVAFDAIDYVGPPEHHFIADTLLRIVRSELDGHQDFRIAPKPGFFPRRHPALTVQARMTVIGNEVRLQLTKDIPASEFRVALDSWPMLRDSVTYRILLAVWDKGSPLAPWLPVDALPQSSLGLAQFLEAERLVADAQWGNAYRAYLAAEATDPSCLLCSWRITEIERWLGREPDPNRVRRYRDHIDAFPSWYQSLIRAAELPLRPRFDTLHGLTDSQRKFFLGWFQLGDELFHRGPLAGYRRSEAIATLQSALREAPGFGPASEHLAWVATAEGDSSTAAAALTALSSHSVASDTYAVVLRALLELGFDWRFLPEVEALRRTEVVANTPAAQSSPDLAAGPRLLPTFDVPRGAVALGRILAASDSRDLRRSGLIAQTLGSLTLGRLSEMRAFAQRLTDVSTESETHLFAAELEGALALLDEGGPPTSEALERLRPWLSGHGVQPQLRDRAAWMSSLLGGHVPLRARGTQDLKLVLTADSLAAAGRPRAALDLLDPIDVDAATRRLDPFFRTIVHLQRADWRARIGDIEGARNELIWHEHSDVVGLPTGMPQAAEVDWAFGTLARWRLARLLDRTGRAERGEACEAYTAVVRHWAQAPAPFGARADTARARARALNCATTR